MKYMSELNRKVFDTVEDCEENDRLFNEQLEKEKEKKTAFSKKLKDAEDALREANSRYDAATEKAAKIIEESDKMVEKILADAQKEVDDAKKVLNEVKSESSNRPNYITFFDLLDLLSDGWLK